MPTTRSSDARSKKAANKSNKAPSAQAIPTKGVSETALATWKMVQAHIDAQKRAAKESEEAAIRARNRELLEAEDGAVAGERGRASKRRKTTGRSVISDDEEDIANGLPPANAMVSARPTQEGSLTDEDEDHQRNAGDDEDLHGDLYGINPDEVDVDMDLGTTDGDLNNELSVENLADDVSVTTSQRSRSKSAAPKTPLAKKQGVDAPNTTNTSKVVEKDFSPRTLKLALASKSHVRTRTIFDETFPRNNKISHINFVWRTIKESAFASEDAEVRQAYKRVTANTAVKSKLMKFTLYGRTGLISSVISKAREKVRAYYGLSGDQDSVKKDVEWLLKSSHFVYGDINLKERTLDKMKPFGAQLIIDIIEAQWFPSTSRSKLDLETTNRIYEKRDLPLNVILLVVTAIEHALKEWCTNGRKATQITFSEDTARLSYERHLRHWKFLESQMKAWPRWWRSTILDQILANHSNFDLNTEDNDFATLDFGELDRLAGYESEQDHDEAGVVAQRPEEPELREAQEAQEAREAVKEARRNLETRGNKDGPAVARGRRNTTPGGNSTDKGSPEAGRSAGNALEFEEDD